MAEDAFGGNHWFRMSEAATPITYGAAQYFNTSDERVAENGGGLTGYVAANQDNVARLLRAIADLELEVQALKAERAN